MRVTEEEFKQMTKKSKKPTVQKIKESDIQRSVKNWLEYKGWFCFKNHQTLGSYKGVADLYAIKNGKSVWIEVKKDNGRQSEFQKKFELQIKQHGGHYVIATCIEDLKTLEGVEHEF